MVVDSEAVHYMHGRRGDECGGQGRLGDRPELAEASLSATKARTSLCRIATQCEGSLHMLVDRDHHTGEAQ